MSIPDSSLQSSNTSPLVEKGKHLINLFIFNSDGPAIWVNETLDKGQTNACATFANDLLTLG